MKWPSKLMNGFRAKSLAALPNFRLSRAEADAFSRSAGWVAIRQQVVQCISECYHILRDENLNPLTRAKILGRLSALESFYGLLDYVEIVEEGDVLEMDREELLDMEKSNALIRELLSGASR